MKVWSLGEDAEEEKLLMTLGSYLAAPGPRRAHPGLRQSSLCLLGPPGFLSEGFDRSACLEYEKLVVRRHGHVARGAHFSLKWDAFGRGHSTCAVLKGSDRELAV